MKNAEVNRILIDQERLSRLDQAHIAALEMIVHELVGLKGKEWQTRLPQGQNVTALVEALKVKL